MQRPLCLATLLYLLFAPASLSHPGAHAALEHFNQQIRLQPLQQSLYIQRGSVYSNDGQYPQALLDFKRASQLGDPLLVSFDLGVLHYRMAQFDRALHYFDSFLERFPNHSACLEYRARLARDSGDYQAAVADFQRLFELGERPNPGHYISTAQMLQQRSPDGVSQALAVLDQANARLGITPQVQHYAITLELQRNQPQKAIERMLALESALGAGPQWKVDLAQLYLGSGQQLQARELLDAASLQLDELRKTPAREQLRGRINELREITAGAITN